MKWFLMLLIFVGGIYYLVNKRAADMREAAHQKALAEEAQKQQLKTSPEAALPDTIDKVYTMRFSQQTLNTLRGLASDPNDQVRFASVELLWQLQDQQAPALIKRMFREEMDSAAKTRLIDMLAREKSRASLSLLAEAINDFDKNTRLKAIEAVSTFPSRESIAVLTKAMQDYDEEIRLKSIEAVNKIKRDIEANKAQEIREIDKQPLFQVE